MAANYWRCLLGDRKRPNKLHLGGMYAVGHKGAPLGKLVHFSALFLGLHQCRHDSNFTIKASSDREILQFSYWHVNVLCGVCIYWLVVLYVLFSPAAASLAPPEQLVLATIRQEASELQDPAQATGVTMRACLTDRFDKSEFAWIRLDDAPFMSGVLRCMWPCATARSRRLPTPGPQELQCLVTRASLVLVCKGWDLTILPWTLNSL